MGLFSGLFGAFSPSGDSDAPACPECGSSLVADGPPDGRGSERFECSNSSCDEPVHFRENGGPLMNPDQRRQSSSVPCTACGQSMAGADLTLPWEDGDNDTAYVTCPHCGTEHPRFGFGEDD